MAQRGREIDTRMIPPAMTAPPPAPRTGQATQIEQSRAVAEVEAAVYVARRFPRNPAVALNAVKESCSQRAVAERAFFRFPRGGKPVTGETIHLAREMARCWGNVQYGIHELSRDDVAGESEMNAYAWDVETNTRVSNTFIVKHRRDKTVGGDKTQETLTDLRDIYENNANMGARRVRECIFAVLPPYLIEDAKATCLATLESDAGSGLTVAQRTANALSRFEALGVTREQLEAKLGRPSGKWTATDLGTLGILHRALERGETTRDEEFETAPVTLAEIEQRPAPKTPEAGPTTEGAPVAKPDDWPEAAKPGSKGGTDGKG